MPLNVPKHYAFTPSPTGPVKLVTRSSRRSRLWAGGSFWRSIQRGETANAIQITAVEDSSGDDPEGLLVVHNTVLKADESISATGMPIPSLKLFEFNVAWDEEIRIFKENDSLVARLYGIRWQIGGGETLRADLGVIRPGRLIAVPGMSIKIETGAWPTGAVLYLRPRTHRYHLVRVSSTDSETMTSTTGWSIQALRVALNGSDTWVRMPAREEQPGTGGSSGGTGGPTQGPQNEDAMDDKYDAKFLTAFSAVNMGGADGLPTAPVGYNTGPDRVLLHLNYAERDDGSMGELNQVFEWVGDSSTIGSWQRYA